MSWWDYVERIAQTDRQRDISDKTGIDATNVSRWKTGQIPKPAIVATFARAYGRPVLEAFVAADFLTEAEAKVRPAGQPDYSQLSNDDLLNLVRSRMTERGEHGGDTAATRNAVTHLGDRTPRDRVDMQIMQTEAARADDHREVWKRQSSREPLEIEVEQELEVEVEQDVDA